MLPDWMSVSAADAFGAAALAGSCLWPLLKNRRAMLLGQAAANVLFIVHFLLLGAGTAAALCTLVVTQVLAALPERRGLLQKIVFAGTVPGIAAVAALTWAGVPSALSALGISFSTLGRWQSDSLRMRVLFLVSGTFWVAHNIAVMSPFAMAADGMAAVSNVARLIEAWRARRRSREVPPSWAGRSLSATAPNWS